MILKPGDKVIYQLTDNHKEFSPLGMGYFQSFGYKTIKAGQISVDSLSVILLVDRQDDVVPIVVPAENIVSVTLQEESLIGKTAISIEHKWSSRIDFDGKDMYVVFSPYDEMSKYYNKRDLLKKFTVI